MKYVTVIITEIATGKVTSYCVDAAISADNFDIEFDALMAPARAAYPYPTHDREIRIVSTEGTGSALPVEP